MAADDCFAEKVAPLSFHNDRLGSSTIGRLISAFLAVDRKKTPRDDFPPLSLLRRTEFCDRVETTETCLNCQQLIIIKPVDCRFFSSMVNIFTVTIDDRVTLAIFRTF